MQLTEPRLSDGTPGKGAADTCIIDIQGVSMAYESRRSNFEALRDINLKVERQSFVVLLGPSGCGKTTLLNMIAGFIRPTAGRVLVEGTPVAGPGPDRVVVHQQTAALLPWLTVEGNVALPLKARRATKAEQREVSAKYLALVGLAGFAEHRIYELSGGMQQRVALARALASESSVVLLDEPLGALDALQRQMMQELLLDVWAEAGRTFVLITHSVEEAVYLATHLVVMTHAPGQILREERLTFGRDALGGARASVKQSTAFVQARARFLELLMGQVEM